MDRKKPALTSPWKVGFLVALLLVVTALGVSYLISGTFGIAWHWLKISGLDPSTWSFNLGAFIDEMLPLLVLTSLLAMGAHVLVAGAVRRYKSYVDSGSDYKQLLKSIKSIEDLQDEQILDSLRQHPELREFVMSMKARVAAMERQNGERDRRQSDGNGGQRGLDRQLLASECGILASAVINGAGGFTRDLALTIPELKQVERAVRQSLSAAAPARAEEKSTARGGLEALRAALRAPMASLRRDAGACATGAREVESALASLRQVIAVPPPAASSNENPAAMLKQIDALADTLAGLGEETRRIAIASALQASGGSDGDSIRVADEVRAMATRFNTISQQWKQTVPALRRSLESPAAARPGASQDAAAALAAVAHKASLWGERAVALGENVSAMERAMDIDAAVETQVEERTPEWGTIDPDLESAPPAEAPAPESVPEPATAAATPDDFVTQSTASVFESASSDEAPFADIPGFEKERRFFAETESEIEVTGHARDSEGRFEIDDHAREGWKRAAAPSVSELADGPAGASPAAEDTDGFLTGPRPSIRPQPIPNDDRFTARPAPRPQAAPAAVNTPPAPAAATATLEPEVVAAADPDADAIDLYVLGAADYTEAA